MWITGLYRNYLNGQIGKDGAIYNKRSGVCFETQFYPNSCNNPEFPSCILPAYKIFKSRTVYQFLHDSCDSK
mgnify:CR=1 FL=1